MRTTEYLDDEDEYIPWKTALNALHYIDLMLSRTASYGLFQAYMRKQVELLYRTYGWHVDADDTDQMLTLLRMEATHTACTYGSKDCLTEATNKFNEWQQSINAGTPYPVSVNYRLTVYCQGIKTGDVDEWDFVWDVYQSEDWPAERERLLEGLSCNTAPWILTRYLERSMGDDEVPQSEAYLVLLHTANNHLGRYLAWDFLRANYDAASKRFGARLSDVVAAITGAFNTQFELGEVHSFRASLPTDDSSMNHMWDTAEETIVGNIQYMTNNEEELVNWLNSNAEARHRASVMSS
ncbi:PREDICTED: aminopeptidase N-like [Priapulus caudatus]|uniref:Aminopeptidase N-like n=1 Tax=Priapulus caudatus TaxID=37621 RepID=A0ABM1DXX3_PRICU|nr:PREDICTED: aminopeptidase N-like [Priapulus caudatus]